MCRASSNSFGEARQPADKVGEPTALFPGSQCPPPSYFWKAALGAPGGLAPPEQEHLRTCARCRAYLARVQQLAARPVEAPAEAYNASWTVARHAGDVAPLRREAGGA